jgi:hypothetical protein
VSSHKILGIVCVYTAFIGWENMNISELPLLLIGVADLLKIPLFFQGGQEAEHTHPPDVSLR